MRSPTTCARVVLGALAVALSPVPLFARGQPAPSVRQLSMDEAVRLALEQNLGIRIEQIKPQIQDVAIAQASARVAGVPMPLASFRRSRRTSSSTKRQAFCIASIRVPSL